MQKRGGINLIELIDLKASVEKLLDESPLNKIEGTKQRIFGQVSIGVADSQDPLFMKLKEQDVIGSHHMTPKEWFSEAVAVISFFLSFTEEVRESNHIAREPSRKWLFGRIEGEIMNKGVRQFVADQVEKDGGKALIPTMDQRFSVINRRSNWSERHVAYIAGLGTFGLSKSFISEKGSAGRIGSVIVNLPYPVTKRRYTDIYQNCNQCGRCIVRCPAQAIDEEGKKHEPCSLFLDETKVKYAPRYGCGKCQTAVPCEYKIPTKVQNIS